MSPIEDLKEKIETLLPDIASDIEMFDGNHWLDVWSWKNPANSLTIQWNEKSEENVFSMFLSPDTDWGTPNLKLTSEDEVVEQVTRHFHDENVVTQ